MTMTSIPKINKNSWVEPIEWKSREFQEKFYNRRNAEYNNLIAIQFQLCYHAHISIGDLDEMTRYEYLEFYKNLKSQKEAERKAIEDSAPKKKGV